MKYTTDNVTLISSILRHAIKTITPNNWEDKNTLVFGTKKDVLGKFTMTADSITASGKTINAFLKKTVAELERLQAQTLKTAEQMSAETIFKEYSDSKYGNIRKVSYAWETLEKRLKAVNISSVYINKILNERNTAQEEPTLMILPSYDTDLIYRQESGQSDRLKTFFNSKYKKKPSTDDSVITDITDEKTKEVKLDSTVVGRYHIDRNLIVLYFNPFDWDKYFIFESELPMIWTDLIGALSSLKIKKTDTSKIRERLFVEGFLVKTKSKLVNNKEQLKRLERDVEQYQDSIRSALTNYGELQQENEFLQNSIDSGGKSLFKELELTKKLPFIESIELKDASILMKFIPTWLEIPTFRRTFGGKSYGSRKMWVGSITFTISPDKFELTSDCKMIRGNPHTHGSSGSSHSHPCFGSGDGKTKIFEMLAANKFSELAKLLWFWIKTHRDDGAYVKMQAYYDDRLSQGYPVWDEKDNRIEINDAARIKSGEQVELTKQKSYAANLEKYKDVTV